MSHSIGDGIVVAALVVGFLGYQYLKFRERQRRLEILHEERLAAMEKGIPLPELPLDPLFVKTDSPPDSNIPFIIGIVLLCFGVGTMIMLLFMEAARGFWAAPLPVAFIGGGLVFYSLNASRIDRGY